MIIGCPCEDFCLIIKIYEDQPSHFSNAPMMLFAIQEGQLELTAKESIVALMWSNFISSWPLILHKEQALL